MEDTKYRDVNCLAGHWPFHAIERSSFDDLREAHARNGISSGYVASLDSIFYNDPLEGDRALYGRLRGSGYRLIQTINPVLPEGIRDIRVGRSELQAAGVRIYPGFHGYRLSDREAEELGAALEAADIPLLVTLRMEDERLAHIFAPAPVPPDDIRRFIGSHPGLRVVLLGIRFAEAEELAPVIRESPRVFIDTSVSVKDYSFSVRKLGVLIGFPHILYGSCFPLSCMESTMRAVRGTLTDSKEVGLLYGQNFQSVFAP